VFSFFTFSLFIDVIQKRYKTNQSMQTRNEKNVVSEKRRNEDLKGRQKDIEWMDEMTEEKLERQTKFKRNLSLDQ